MKQSITTQNAKGWPELLSQAIICNGFIYTSGYVHISENGILIEGTTTEKFRIIMKNLSEILKAANASFGDVIKVTIYVTDIAIVPELNESYKTYFKQPMPARETVCVKALPLGASIEISMVGYI